MSGASAIEDDKEFQTGIVVGKKLNVEVETVSTFCNGLIALVLVDAVLDMEQQVYPLKKRKVQGVPQSQTAALPRHQEEEETDKTKQAQIEQTYEKH